MAESFGVEDRGHFYDPVGAVRDVVVNHLMQVVALAAMEPPAGDDAETLKDAKFALFRSIRAADPAHYVRGQYDGYRDIDGVAADSTTETYAAMRLEIDNWRWAGVPWFIRTGKRLPITQTELRAVFREPPRLGFMEHGHRRPEPNQFVVKLDPSTGTGVILDAHRADLAGPRQITLDMEFAEQGGEAPTPYEVLLLDADARRQHPLHPPGRRRGDLADIRSRCWTTPPPVHPTPLARGARRPLTGCSRASARGAALGCRHEPAKAHGHDSSAPRAPRQRAQGRSAAERGDALAVSADRRLRVSVELPHRRAGRARRRVDWLCVPRFDCAERVRHAARPPGRRLPLRALRHQRALGAHLRARHEHPADDVEDADRLGDRARRADPRALAAARIASRRTRAHRPTTTPSTCSCAWRCAWRARSRWS